MEKNNKKLIVILGPTATGKTRLAVELARKYNGEIISADSRQVYRGMDIGTGKDLAEYGSFAKKRLGKATRASRGNSGRASQASREPQGVKYHLIDIISPKTQFNVAKYQKLAYKAIAEAQKTDKLPFLVGGTGLYIDSVIQGFRLPQKIVDIKKIRAKLDKLSLPQLLAKLKKIDLETFKIIDKRNRRRVQRALEIYFETGKKKSDQQEMLKPDLDILILGVKFPLEEIYRKIDRRLEARIKEGMIKEIKKLRRQGVSWKRLDEFGLEYRYVSRYLRGLLSYKEMLEQLKLAIHHFAKRQLTWFKRNDGIIWIESMKEAEILVGKFAGHK